MYRVAAPESMPCPPPLPQGSAFRIVSLLLLLLAIVLILPGCGVKKLSSDDPFVAVQSTGKSEPVNHQAPGTGYLPKDDGRSLSPEEMNALLSVGDFDKGLSATDMRDVILHFKFLVHDGRRTVERNVARANLYMPQIKRILKEKRVPGELAYLPFVESGYDPLAQSGSGALGMWQFIRSTGNQYGMDQDWWIDERRDVYQSTDAAATYLSKLGNMFDGDWHLAISAYNAGEGKIGRGLVATDSKTFFQLRSRDDRINTSKDKMTNENKQYLPKFLAVCKIMRNLENLGFPPLVGSSASKMTELVAKPGTDLMALTKSLGMSWDQFFVHNTAYMRYITPPGKNTKVYVPQYMESQARAFLSKPQTKAYAGWKPYTVAGGDSLSRIARKTGVSVAELQRVNQMDGPLQSGSVILVPGSKNANRAMASREPAGNTAKASGRNANVRQAQATRTHEVRRGDTVFSIARQYNVSQQALLAANNLSSGQVRLGQRLTLPSTGSWAVADNAPLPVAKNTSRVKTTSYTVRDGDSLWGIARKFNVSPNELLSLNNLDRSATLRPGDTVKVMRP